MLSLHPERGRLRRADNLVPTEAGTLRTRPGAVQVVAGTITAAVPWGPWLVLERSGRIAVWDGAVVHDIAQAGLWLRGAPFAALVQDGQRETRIYLADGVRPLWYIAHRNGAFVAEMVLNSLADDTGQAYPLAVATDVAVWRNRVWLVDAALPTRIHHCENDDPTKWDPLWAIEIQSGERDRIQTIVAAGERLIVGFRRSLWAVTGDSPYNWQRAALHERGSGGPGSIVADGEALAWLSEEGVYLGGSPVGEPLRILFGRPQAGSLAALDPYRRWLTVALGGRLFVMHLAQPGQWGEIVPAVAVLGALRWDGKLAWYGGDGLWVLVADDEPDVSNGGLAMPFLSRYDTWEEFPNLGGDGRALLERDVFHLVGSGRGIATYIATASGPTGELSYSETFTLTDEDLPVPAEEEAAPWPPRPVRREAVPRLPGHLFRRQLASLAHLEILANNPQYRPGGDS